MLINIENSFNEIFAFLPNRNWDNYRQDGWGALRRLSSLSNFYPFSSAGANLLNRSTVLTADLRQDRPISNGCCSLNVPPLSRRFLFSLNGQSLEFATKWLSFFLCKVCCDLKPIHHEAVAGAALERLGMSKSPQTRRCTTGTIYTANIKMFEVRALAFESTSPNYVNQSWGKGFPIHFRFLLVSNYISRVYDDREHSSKVESSQSMNVA